MLSVNVSIIHSKPRFMKSCILYPNIQVAFPSGGVADVSVHSSFVVHFPSTVAVLMLGYSVIK